MSAGRSQRLLQGLWAPRLSGVRKVLGQEDPGCSPSPASHYPVTGPWFPLLGKEQSKPHRWLERLEGHQQARPGWGLSWHHATPTALGYLPPHRVPRCYSKMKNAPRTFLNIVCLQLRPSPRGDRKHLNLLPLASRAGAGPFLLLLGVGALSGGIGVRTELPSFQGHGWERRGDFIAQMGQCRPERE